jgi:hypothetical protein
MRQAARAGDAEGFASAAVRAMRVACAPHYPAEPRALVGSDVLQVLAESSCSAELQSAVSPIVHRQSVRYFQAPFDVVATGMLQTCDTADCKSALHAPELESKARTSEIVRRFFAVTDATRFDTETPKPQELLSLQSELESVLEELEARL